MAVEERELNNLIRVKKSGPYLALHPGFHSTKISIGCNPNHAICSHHIYQGG